MNQNRDRHLTVNTPTIRSIVNSLVQLPIGQEQPSSRFLPEKTEPLQ
jgi:hypothetical protein